jgi:methylaspartate ammonia-lyase
MPNPLERFLQSGSKRRRSIGQWINKALDVAGPVQIRTRQYQHRGYDFAQVLELLEWVLSLRYVAR